MDVLTWIVFFIVLWFLVVYLKRIYAKYQITQKLKKIAVNIFNTGLSEPVYEEMNYANVVPNFNGNDNTFPLNNE